MSDSDRINAFIADWAVTGGSELANTQSFVNGLCALVGVDPSRGSQTDDANNDYVFERRVFQDNGDGTISFDRKVIDLMLAHGHLVRLSRNSSNHTG